MIPMSKDILSISGPDNGEMILLIVVVVLCLATCWWVDRR